MVFNLGNGLSAPASISIMLVVTACFACLWPTIFYPMLMVGLKMSPQSQASWEKTATPESILPPKVREAMKSNPTRELPRVQRVGDKSLYYQDLTPRPGLHRQAPTKGSAMNIVIPVYTICVVMFFIFILIKMSLNGSANEPSQPTTGPKRMPGPSAVDPSCAQCTHRKIRPYEATTSRARRGVDPYKDTSSYRTFTQLGQGDATRSMHALISHMETFRNHLAVAEVYKVRMTKFAAEAEGQDSETTENTKQSNESNKGTKAIDKEDPVEGQVGEEENLKGKGESQENQLNAAENNEVNSTAEMPHGEMAEDVQPINQENDIELCDKENGSANDCSTWPVKRSRNSNKLRRRRGRKASNVKSVENDSPNKKPLKHKEEIQNLKDKLNC